MKVAIIGSAIRDNFLILKDSDFKISKAGGFLSNQSIYFPFGSKIALENLFLSIGGGAVNVAISLKKQGFSVGLVAKIGRDKKGEAILNGLKRENIPTNFIVKSKIPTSSSYILSTPKKERTIFIFGGASDFLSEKEINWQAIKKAEWLYLAPLNGKSIKLFNKAINFAKKNGLNIAVNLSKEQLKEKSVLSVLKKVDIVFLNREEASILSGCKTGVSEIKILRNITKKTKAIIAITNGEKDSFVLAGDYLFKAQSHRIEIVEKTGAGDAFAAGFISGLLEKNNIEYAIQLATNNAAACVQKIGANNGVLAKGNRYKIKLVKITKRKLKL